MLLLFYQGSFSAIAPFSDVPIVTAGFRHRRRKPDDEPPIAELPIIAKLGTAKVSAARLTALIARSEAIVARQVADSVAGAMQARAAARIAANKARLAARERQIVALQQQLTAARADEAARVFARDTFDTDLIFVASLLLEI